MAAPRDIEPVRRVLADMGFPASKDDIVARVEREGADVEVVSALRAMPQTEYYDEDQVLRFIPIDTAADDAPEAGRSRGDRSA
ncbi:hypothetical protein HDA32_005413 [Spinactinospora alkalitolerans]|uniref:DUF2795 domain-containing protein n=1 Tax=Spinactinospora alkalitolerans TaxID=687207 RepID=A0A852U5Z8_9ACTN|nr:DUF2795 domain-containing protein [Spinactinospora alkalitolerans]NYE50293.1 hypothetical protein [Spinactinospora alkalitolerans]